jgi:hypothetical protein
MSNLILVRATALALGILALTVVGQKAQRIESPPLSEKPVSVNTTPVEAETAADPASKTSTFFTVRRDLRRCVSPICGGFFVKRVNLTSTPCGDGKPAPECYVARIDWNGHAEVEDGRALLRGNIISQRFQRFGKLAVLTVTESWQAASENQPAGVFFRVRDRGLRCIAAPCLTHHEARLNTTASRNIAGVDLSGANAEESTVSNADAAMTSQDGVLVAGSHAPVNGPAGRSETLKASQFYLRAGQSAINKPQPGKPCQKTGCSRQICSDHTVMSTCEWREEYACYQKATCERQADGNCGFTKTPELTACLARR